MMKLGIISSRSIVGANSRNWVSSIQKYCGCRFVKLGIIGSELMMKLGIIGSELMMKLGIINSEDFHHLRRLRI
jgi:hypothetical protein